MTTIGSIVPRTDKSAKLILLILKKQFLAHQEFIKFALVGLTTMIVDICFFYTLTLTFMGHHPTIAKIIAGTIAMCISYILNSTWAFKNRGGRARQHEIILFFVISSCGIVIGAAPEFFVNSLTNWRSNTHNIFSRVLIDFLLNYIIGNIAQMIFRFWALRKFAYPTTIASVTPDSAETPAPIEPSPIIWPQSPASQLAISRPANQHFSTSHTAKPVSIFLRSKQDSQ